MSVSANTGNASLDSLARQINHLEQDPNATPGYDQALDAWFAAVKAQVLGSGGGGAAPASGSGNSVPTAGAGSGSTGSSGQSVDDSVAKVTSAAGSDAGDAVDRRRLVAKARKAIDRDVHQVPPPILLACGPF